MLKRMIGGVLLGMLIGSISLNAQEWIPPVQVPDADHAAIGTLTAIDEVASTITMTTFEQTEFKLRFDSETIVRGLMKCKDVLTLLGKEGESVVVHFAEAEGLPLALSVHYLGKAPIYQVVGTVQQIDRRVRNLSIRNQSGKKQQFEIARRAPIDGPRGIVPFRMFAEKKKQRVTIYYTPTGEVNLAVLVKQEMPAAS